MRFTVAKKRHEAEKSKLSDFLVDRMMESWQEGFEAGVDSVRHLPLAGALPDTEGGRIDFAVESGHITAAEAENFRHEGQGAFDHWVRQQLIALCPKTVERMGL